MAEPEEVETSRFVSVLPRRSRRGLEAQQPCLVWMELQVILRETFAEQLEDQVGILAVTEDQDEIIRIADEMCFAFQARHDVRREPFVEDCVKVDVG